MWTGVFKASEKQYRETWFNLKKCHEWWTQKCICTMFHGLYDFPRDQDFIKLQYRSIWCGVWSLNFDILQANFIITFRQGSTWFFVVWFQFWMDFAWIHVWNRTCIPIGCISELVLSSSKINFQCWKINWAVFEFFVLIQFSQVSKHLN